MTPAQAAAERVEAFLAARMTWMEDRRRTLDFPLDPDRVLSIPGDAMLYASDLRALVVAAWGAEG